MWSSTWRFTASPQCQLTGQGVAHQQVRSAGRSGTIRVCAHAAHDYSLSHKAFGNSPGPHLQLAVLGDLHLAPEQMDLFNEARDQIKPYLCDEHGVALPGSKLVQLGDLGHAKHNSGSRQCYEFAKSFLDSFGLPYSLILGNHDMEGSEFPTDPDNLEAWQDAWDQPHHWCADLGPCVAIGLSTTRYRSNTNSHHEVHIDEPQMAWFEAQLERLAAQGRYAIVFTHAPPQGCGLKVVQEVHIKNRCAWLNHSDRPERFMDLVQRFPNTIRLWFSGHFHLSHNYQDSISTVGGTAFVQTGVIGACHRDGFRHSRLISADMTSFRVLTFDHGSSSPPRLDLAHRWDDPTTPAIMTPQDAFINSADVAGWLSSEVECSVGLGAARAKVTRKRDNRTRWFPIGSKTMLALQNGALVEYDLATRAPIGLVCKVPPGCEVVLKAQGGAPASPQGDGSDVEVVEVVDNFAGGSSRFTRNLHGGFFVNYQPNKWQLTHAKLMAERDAAKAQAGAAATAAA